MNAAPAMDDGRNLTWLDRAICGYLVLPLLLFCLLFQLPAAIALFGLATFGISQAICRGKSPPCGLSLRWWCGIAVLALTWSALSGVGHVYFANTDWIIRDAVLHDIVAAGGLPSYQPPDGAPLLLRAPIAYYLPAAALGLAFGQGATQFGLFVWTFIGVALFLASACRLFTTNKQRVLCLLVLVLFSGMDLLGYIWRTRSLPLPGENIEWWLSIIQFPSNAYLLAWVPNHALPAWLATTLIVKYWRKAELATVTPLLAAAIPLWSPLAAIGLFPFFLFGLRWQKDFRTLFSISQLHAVPLPAVAAASYLTMSAATIKHGWFFNAYPTLGSFLYSYTLFCLLEFGVLALVLFRLTKVDVKFVIAVTMLCLLPLYVYGPYNDVAMRSSIPPLLILALAAVEPLANYQRSAWHALLVGVLGLGSITALQELVRPLLLRSWPALNQSIPDAVMTEHSWSPTRYPTHYLATYGDHGISRWLRPPVRIDHESARQVAQ